MRRLIPLFFVVLVLVLVGSGCESKTPPTDASLDDTWTRPADKIVMVYVPEGEFEMGSDDGDRDERPVHTVGLDGFWIDRAGVTNAQYRQCVEAGECEPPMACTEGEGQPTYEESGKTEHPVVCVDWFVAKAYCEWAGGRLPTEAEWEYAARGPEGFKYPWGDNEPNDMLLNYFPSFVGDTTEVGSYPDGASWCGALDMAGNVWEWAADWYAADYYAASPSTNPTGPSSGSKRVIRGGSWDNVAFDVRTANDYRSLPEGRWRDTGFRCARDAD